MVHGILSYASGILDPSLPSLRSRSGNTATGVILLRESLHCFISLPH